jgi:hypothetical protein
VAAQSGGAGRTRPAAGRCGRDRLSLGTVPGSDPLLPPQVHAASLHALVEVYVAEGLAGGDLAALGPVRLLSARVDYLLHEHARLAHDADGHSWSTVGAALGVTGSAAAKRYGPISHGPNEPTGD